jgi:hypothetical protein
MGVLAAGEKGVEVFGENGEVAFGVVDAGVVVVGHRHDEENPDLGTLGGEGEAIDEGVVGIVVRAQEEAPLGATAGNHVVGTRQNLAWEAHAKVSVRRQEKLLENYLRLYLRSSVGDQGIENYLRLGTNMGPTWHPAEPGVGGSCQGIGQAAGEVARKLPSVGDQGRKKDLRLGPRRAPNRTVSEYPAPHQMLARAPNHLLSGQKYQYGSCGWPTTGQAPGRPLGLVLLLRFFRREIFFHLAKGVGAHHAGQLAV